MIKINYIMNNHDVVNTTKIKRLPIFPFILFLPVSTPSIAITLLSTLCKTLFNSDVLSYFSKIIMSIRSFFLFLTILTDMYTNIEVSNKQSQISRRIDETSILTRSLKFHVLDIFVLFSKFLSSPYTLSMRNLGRALILIFV